MPCPTSTKITTPFGLEHGHPDWYLDTDNRYLYNGKELQTDFNLNWYDYGARFYDPVIGRWTTPDPLLEKYHQWTPYNYCINNPLKFIDPNGMEIYVTPEAILAIYMALKNGTNVRMDIDQDGRIVPESIKDQAENSDDNVLKDLYEIAKSPKVVDMWVDNSFDYRTNNGEIKNSDDTDSDVLPFDIPKDYNTSEDPSLQEQLILNKQPIGKDFVGKTGRSLFPTIFNITGANSTNDHIQIIINGNGQIPHQALGVAEEFVHVVLYLRSNGRNYQHGQECVNEEISKRLYPLRKMYDYD